MDIIQATAIATRVLQWAANETIPPTMPDYVTASSTTVGFQMRSFEQVKEWAVYLEAEFDYTESVTNSYQGSNEVTNVGFANVRRTVKDPDFGEYRIHVYHNEVIKPEQGETLFDMPGAITPEDM